MPLKGRQKRKWDVVRQLADWEGLQEYTWYSSRSGEKLHSSLAIECPAEGRRRLEQGDDPECEWPLAEPVLLCGATD